MVGWLVSWLVGWLVGPSGTGTKSFGTLSTMLSCFVARVEVLWLGLRFVARVEAWGLGLGGGVGG